MALYSNSYKLERDTSPAGSAKLSSITDDESTVHENNIE